MSADSSSSLSPDSIEISVPSTPAAFDLEFLSHLKSHLTAVCPLLFSSSAAGFIVALASPAADEILRNFVADAMAFALIVHRKTVKQSDSTDSDFYSFELSIRNSSVGDSSAAVSRSALAFIKSVPTFDSSQPISSQLYVCSLSDSSLFETILSYVRHLFLPFSRSLVTGSGSADDKKDSELAVYRGVNRKLGELEVELLRFQENVDIPLINLELHPVVANSLRASKLSGKPLKVEELGELASSPEFLNEIQQGLNEWKKTILRVTKLNRDVSSGSTIQELNFWTAMERAISHIYDQRESAGVEFTFNILKQNKRFLATTGFNQDVGLAEQKDKDKVFRYQELLRELPIKRLLAAADVQEIARSIEALFTHIKQIRRIDYPLARAILLVQAISRDLVNQIQSVLNARRLLSLNFDEFSLCTSGCDEIFSMWAAKVGEFTDLIRTIQKKKPGESIAKLTDPYTELNELRSRIAEIRRIRKEHEELKGVISDTLANDQYVRNSALESITSAFAHLRDFDILNISAEGRDSFDSNIAVYSSLIDRVEGDLELKIRQFLDAAKDDANEMFRVCAKFNALFVRPRIQSAIREYQEQLIATVKKDILGLQNKFNSRIAKVEQRKMSKLHDMPPVSASMIWAKQIERQLNIYMNHVENVLGKQWHHHIEGRALKRDTDDFRAKLKPTRLNQAWLMEKQDQAAQLQAKGSIFKIVATSKQVSLAVNFDKKLITLFKEVRNLSRLDVKIPFELIATAEEAKQNYPFAMRLEEVIRIYSRTCQRLDSNKQLSSLSAGLKKSIQDSISKGVNLQWFESQVKNYVDQLGTQAIEFQDQVDELAIWLENSQKSLKKLEETKPDSNNFKSILMELQSVIDHLDKRGFSNLDEFANFLDSQVESILVRRLALIVQCFVQSLNYDPETKLRLEDESSQKRLAQLRETGIEDANEEEKEKNQREADAIGMDFRDFIMKEPIKHEILIRNQLLQLDPPLENARLSLTKSLHQWLALVCELPRLRLNDAISQSLGEDGKRIIGGRLINSTGDADDGSYRLALTKIDPAILSNCFNEIESKLGAAYQYSSSWLQYQALWDLDIDLIVHDLGNDLSLWERLLVDMKKARGTFDNAEKRRKFGPIVIEYGSVQAKVNNKYDQWHKTILARFGSLLGDRIVGLLTSIRSGRDQLEKHSFDFSNTADIVDSVTILQELNSKAAVWSSELEKQKSVEKLLQRQRFIFPADWMFSDRVDGEWQAFQQILQRKLAKMKEETPNIQAKIGAEDIAIDNRMKEFTADWKKNRPLQGDLDHKLVENLLAISDTKLNSLESDLNRLNLAKRALDIPVKDEFRLAPVREELAGLREVWSHLAASWNEIDSIGEKLFREVKPSELRKQLTRIQSDVQKLPNQMRQYEAFEHLRGVIKNYLAMNGSLVELHSGVLRPKHEKQLLKELGIPVQWSELTVGMLWIKDLKAQAKSVKIILDQAQGEGALEEFLNELRDQWEATKFDLVDYRGKNFLVRNWDALFSQLTDRLSDLAGMKQSPFFKSFEREANQWEAKLNLAQAIFDLFIDIQRRWVYLEGIMIGSADVQIQLAAQFKRFKTFDKEFVRLMRDIKKDSAIDIWIREERHLLSELTSFAETLNAIQKALGEYLEKQRSAFPRFYFVGDEDLLEIIGNAKNPVKILRHLSKMFAGIASLDVTEDQKMILGMASKEGEIVKFKQAIVLEENSSVHAWLNSVQYQMRFTLAALLEEAIVQLNQLDEQLGNSAAPSAAYIELLFGWINKFPAQIILLAISVQWSANIESALSNSASSTLLASILQRIDRTLELLADRILRSDLTSDIRKKYEQLITERVHQRDVTRRLIKEGVSSPNDFRWVGTMRYVFTPFKGQKTGLVALSENDRADPLELKVLEVRISRVKFQYGLEYLGVPEILVQTPLTDQCFLTLAEALHMKLGGNPFGPAGTGKTETVKQLASSLGYFCTVFCCDESFDLQAMGRIFVGLCQCGAWGCFDEFNRLEERILSAVSQQILTIQTGIRDGAKQIQLLGKSIKLDDRMGLFVTMNPAGSAGFSSAASSRSQLPDNLKQLFRGIAMFKPDYLLIAQVMLFSQGFRTAEELSGKIVLLFNLCEAQLSARSHYDFGLRALKSCLRSAGELKRKAINKVASAEEEKQVVVLDNKSEELELLLKSISSTIVPKLVSHDVALFSTLVRAVFPSSSLVSPPAPDLRTAIAHVCRERHLVDIPSWIDKILQLNEIQSIHHGVIMVGPSATGKSSAWSVLREAIEKVDGSKIGYYLIDPKALSKEELYGSLDNTTLEWTDGVFTALLRKIIDNIRGEAGRKHWIIFDGDVDPEWAENLNSVLDDNKILTLPNGERLALNENIRIMFEVQNLNFATPATVSRCGMVWFSREVLSTAAVIRHFLLELKFSPISHASLKPTVYQRWKNVQEKCGEILENFIGIPTTGEMKLEELAANSMVLLSLDWAARQSHIMKFNHQQAVNSLFSLLKGGIAKIIDYDDNHADFPLSDKNLEAYLGKYLIFSLLWAFGGSLSLQNRVRFCDELTALCPSSISLPAVKTFPLIDYEVVVESGEWENWSSRVENVELDTHKVIRSDVVIDTVDTVRHTEVIGQWLADRKPLILCGPAGSGKSMTLTAVLKSMPEFDLVTLNFSSSTTTKLLLDCFYHHCKCERTPNGLIMRPVNVNKWLCIFADEINLPAEDKYKTQHVITLMRQISEHGGFWRASDTQFIKLERIQIIGACNPPTDAGRVALSPRFLRHTPLLFVDFPGVPALRQIYGTFNRALLKLQPTLRGHWESITDCMIEIYSQSQSKFTPDIQPHYIYSPRELSRWVRALFEALKPIGDSTSITGWDLSSLCRLLLHESLRLFQDRLTAQSERDWTDSMINGAIKKYFPSLDHTEILARPVLFSNWISKQYSSVDKDALRVHVKTRLRVFYEEELDVKLVIFDEVLEHILRIDRVLRQPLGHLLLVGVSGGGKTVLSKFVAWMNGMSVFQIKVHKYYTGKDFDKDLRSVLIRSGCKGENICFIFDESNVLDTAFLERMNALLAGGEVPGLFEGQDYTALMAECKEMARRENLILDSEEELFKHFTAQVQRRLHVVFTMNPANEDFDNRSATSPALFNRCVIDWFGEWSSQALYQVGLEFTKSLDLGDGAVEEFEDEEKPTDKQSADAKNSAASTARDLVIQTLVYIHESVRQANIQLALTTAGRSSYVTPRHYLDFIKQYSGLFHEKRSQLEDQQRHLNTGLRKLRETSEEVQKLQQELTVKDLVLRENQKKANDKLEQMMIDKREAESKRDVSIQIAAEIKDQEFVIAQRREAVEKELGEAKPALDDAESAVKGIKKADLDQVSRFPNPPAPVKLAMEAVVIMLGEGKLGWEDIRKVLRRADFIKSVIDYDINKINEKIRKQIQKEYLADPNFAYDIVFNASKACGPLVKWVESTLNFARIKNSVAPLEEEMKALVDKADNMKVKQAEITAIQNELGTRIDQLKIEYSALIGEVERIKNEMSSVQTKVDRSSSLLTNLSSEKIRWDADSNSFQTQISTVVGDCLLAAAFIAYIGYFNQNWRELLVANWQAKLESMKVKSRSDLNLIEYLSHPSERLEWQANNLPNDELNTSNAIMIKRFNRYPLIIDPSGLACDFLMKQFKERKIIRTSFLDDAFLKNLESALRFGNALLVEDVENIDPILNSVLNKEIRKNGGRVMITLGDKEIDFSPAFVIFLATRDATAKFTPDLASRVTFVNFTVTHSSLSSQCLSKILRAERKDINAKRSDLLKLQGEFRVRLRSLEESLLNSLSSVRGNILDDDSVMKTLETLKSEAAEVQQKMSESDRVMEECTTAANQYSPFAAACSSIYFSLEKLSEVHFLYQFSLPLFLSIVDKLLNPATNQGHSELKDNRDPTSRLQILTRMLFENTYSKIVRSLLNADQLAFAIRLAQIALEEANFAQPIQDNEFQFFIRGAAGLSPATPMVAPKDLAISKFGQQQIADLNAIPAFKALTSHITSANNLSDWLKYMKSPTCLHESESKSEFSAVSPPLGWDSSSAPAHVVAFRSLLIAKILRPDRVPIAAAAFVQAVFGPKFPLNAANSIDLVKLVQEESVASVPLLLVSKPGFDASHRVDQLAVDLNNKSNYQSFAMGSPEGYEQADLAINNAAKKGCWILLKNVHLSPTWLTQLEKRLHRMNFHPNFRLFLTMELNPKVPSNFLRMSNILIFEPPVGLKASMKRMFAQIPNARIVKAPAERARLYFLLSWLHAIILERLRYAPVGWSKPFEFSESDVSCAIDAIDEWVDKTAAGRANLAPDKIPWDAIRKTLEQVVYGGRIDNEFDQLRLSSFVRSLFVSSSFDSDFALTSHVTDAGFAPLLKIPDFNNIDGFKRWIDEMDDNSSPELLGLPANAELMLLKQHSSHLIKQVSALQDQSKSDEIRDSIRVGEESEANAASTRPVWMAEMERIVLSWIAKLPTANKLKESSIANQLTKSKQLAELDLLIQNPLFRCVQREFTIYCSLLETVSGDLFLLRDVLNGSMKGNNRARELISLIKREKLPAEWGKSYPALNYLSLDIWITDLVRRLTQIQRLVGSKADSYQSQTIWLGGFTNPDGFVSATRQIVAAKNSWPLEQLELKMELAEGGKPDGNAFIFSGLTLQCADWDAANQSLAIPSAAMNQENSNSIETLMGAVKLIWSLQQTSNRSQEENYVTAPVYVDSHRSTVLFSMKLKRPANQQIPASIFYDRGTCLTVWNHDGADREEKQ